MQPTVAVTRLLILAAAFAAVLLVAAPLAAEAAARQFCSPNGDVCLGPLDCCSGQCVNAVCCDEYLGTCPFDYYDPYWGRNTVSNATVPTTAAPEEPATTATELVSTEEKLEEASTPNTL
ncbi:uncharacterized protein [Dermacentor albipictus]|uniref:uncharacterized protein n=1 Tax=Dermacentor albipictus TaxID=60249 RepID=UPI0038FC95AD